MRSQLTSELLQGPLVNPDKTMAYPFYVYFRSQEGTVDQGPTRIGSPIILTEQNAAIGTTPITGETITAGIYRITYYLEITTADGVASNARLNISWVNGTVKTHSFADVNGDTTATTGSESYMVNISTVPLTYNVTYASTTLNKMEYSLYLTLEAMAV